LTDTPENIEALIVAYLHGEASPDQAIALDAWRQAAPGNERHFIQVCMLYGKNPAAYDWNADTAWDQIKPKSAKVIPFKSTPQRWTALRVAAGIALLAAVAAVVYTLITPSVETHFAEATTEQKIDTLPGNHIVTLNRASSLAYEKRRNTETIALTGEAWFDLESKKDITTTVQTGALQIQDIGTSFGVSTRGDTTTVLVTEGAVQLFTDVNPGILLTAGQSGWFIASTGAITPILNPTPETYEWRTRNFHFSGVTLAEVVRRVNAAYAIQLELDGPIDACKITAGFNDESPETIAEVLAETLGLTLHNEPGKIILKGEACEN
jgi:ferric-dicitrate binding protein FerR (iron transport regulator)